METSQRSPTHTIMLSKVVSHDPLYLVLNGPPHLGWLVQLVRGKATFQASFRNLESFALGATAHSAVTYGSCRIVVEIVRYVQRHMTRFRKGVLRAHRVRELYGSCMGRGWLPCCMFGDGAPRFILWRLSTVFDAIHGLRR
jgi:hypothetical protein